MSGAEQAADVVDEALRNPQRESGTAAQAGKAPACRHGALPFFIYRFNGPVMAQMFSEPRNVWQLEQGVISMLAGDLFDYPKVLRRLKLFKLVYAIAGLRDWRRWRAEHKYRLAQARWNSPAAPRRSINKRGRGLRRLVQPRPPRHPQAHPDDHGVTTPR